MRCRPLCVGALLLLCGLLCCIGSAHGAAVVRWDASASLAAEDLGPKFEPLHLRGDLIAYSGDSLHVDSNSLFQLAADRKSCLSSSLLWRPSEDRSFSRQMTILTPVEMDVAVAVREGRSPLVTVTGGCTTAAISFTDVGAIFLSEAPTTFTLDVSSALMHGPIVLSDELAPGFVEVIADGLPIVTFPCAPDLEAITILPGSATVESHLSSDLAERLSIDDLLTTRRIEGLIEAKDDTFQQAPLSTISYDVLANDFPFEELDPASLLIVSVPSPIGCAIVSVLGGEIIVTSTLITGLCEFTYQISDFERDIDTAVVRVTVQPGAACNPDFAMTVTPVPITIDVVHNDLYPGPLMSLTIESPPALCGLASVTANEITFFPLMVGGCTFTYRAVDASLNFCIGQVDVFVPAEPVVANADSFSVAGGSTLLLNVLENDTPVAKLLPNTLIVTAVPAPTNCAGPVTVVSGEISFTAGTIAGDCVFAYEITSSEGESDIGTVTVNVTIDPVVAVDDSESAQLDGNIYTFTVLDNDTPFALLDPTTLTDITMIEPGCGTFVMNPTGDVTFTPSAIDTCAAIYRIESVSGSMDTATITVSVKTATVNCVLDTALGPADEELSIDVLANDTPFFILLPDSLEVSSSTSPEDCGVAIAADGMVSFTGLVPGQCSFTYSVNTNQATTGQGEVTVTVGASTITANDDNTVAVSGTSILIDVLANDTPAASIDASTLTIVTAPVPVGCATGTVNPDVSEVFFLGLFPGECVITYSIMSLSGAIDFADITVMVSAEPVICMPDASSTDSGSVISVDVLANDSPLAKLVPATLALGLGLPAPAGCAVISVAMGELLVDPVFPSECSVQYQVSSTEGETGSSSLTVTITAEPVSASDDSATIAANSDQLVNVLLNDSPFAKLDPSSLMVTSFSPAACATATNVGGQLEITAIIFGTCTITYAVTTTEGETGSANVQVDVTAEPVTAQDDVAFATADSRMGPETIMVDVIANDTPLAKLIPATVIVTPASCGTASLSLAGMLTFSAENAGICTLGYSVESIEGASDTATVTISVAAEPVVAVSDLSSTTTADSVSIDVLANDHPLSKMLPASLTFSAITPVGCGVPTLNGGVVEFVGLLIGNCDFTYSVTTTEGEVGTALVSVTIAPQPVVAAPDSLSLASGSGTTIDVLANDSPFALLDTGSLAISVGPSPPGCGSAIVSLAGIVFDALDSNLSPCVFSYTISSVEGTFDEAEVTVVISPELVVAAPDASTLVSGTSTTIDVLANDSPLAKLDPSTLSLSIAPSPAGCGTAVSISGVIDFTALAVSSCTFAYSITTTEGAAGVAFVTVTITPEPVVALDDSANSATGQLISIPVLANDQPFGLLDPTTLSLTGVAPVPGGCGIAAINSGIVEFTGSVIGECSFEYTIETVDGAVGTGAVTVTVSAQPVLAVGDNFVLSDGVGSSATLEVLANDEPALLLDSSTLIITAPPSPAGCAVIGVSDGAIDFVADEIGICTFAYEVTTTEGAVGGALVSLDVMPEAIVTVADFITISAELGQDVNVLANDSPSAKLLPASLSSGEPVPAGCADATVVGGLLRVIGHDLGSCSVTYSVTSDEGASGMGVLTLAIEAELVDAVNDSGSVEADAPQTLFDVLGNDSPQAKLDLTSLTIITGPTPAGCAIVSVQLNEISVAGLVTGLCTVGYSVTTTEGAVGQAILEVSVSATPVTAVSDTATTFVGASGSVDVLANDSPLAQLDPATLQVTSILPLGCASAVAGVASTIDYMGLALGECTIGYEIETVHGATGQSSLQLSVVPEPVVANPDAAVVETDNVVTIAVVANDTPQAKLDLATLSTTFDAPSPAGCGSVSTSPTPGSLAFTGLTVSTCTFMYTISSTEGTSATGVVTVTVDAEEVSCEPDFYAVVEGGSIAAPILNNDSPLLKLDITTLSFTPPLIACGTLVDTGGQFLFTADVPSATSCTFSYSISSFENESGVGTVQFTISAAPPVVTAVDDAFPIVSQSNVHLHVLGNDSPPLAELSFETLFISSQPSPPSCGSAAPTTPMEGGYGRINFTAFTPGICVFDYTISSLAGASGSATVTITITEAPVVAVDDFHSQQSFSVEIIDVLANDDPLQLLDGDSLLITADPPASCGVAAVTSGPAAIEFTSLGAGSCSLTYSVTSIEGPTDSATVTLDITASPIVAVDDASAAVGGSSIAIDVLANDEPFDLLDASSLTVIGSPSPTGCGTVVMNAGLAQFTAINAGICSFNYFVSSTEGASGTALVTVTVSAEPVLAMDDAFTVGQAPVILDVLSNDVPGAKLDAATLFVTAPPMPSMCGIAVARSGAIDFMPLVAGDCVFLYTITSTEGASDSAQVVVSVAAEPVIAQDDVFTVTFDVESDLDILANDSPSEKLNVVPSLLTGPSPAGCGIVQPQLGSMEFKGSIVGTCSFSYEVTSTEGATDSANVSVNVLPEPVIPMPDAGNGPAGELFTFDVIANDLPLGLLDPNSLLVLAISPIGCGTAGVTAGMIDFTGLSLGPCEVSYSVGYIGGTGIGLLTVEVTEEFILAVPDEPFSAAKETVLTIDVLANDLGSIDDSTLAIAAGSLMPTGCATVTVVSGFSGAEIEFFGLLLGPCEFAYEVDSTTGTGSGTSTVTVTVLPTPVIANSDAGTVPVLDTILVDVLLNDSPLGLIDPSTLVVLQILPSGCGSALPIDGSISFTGLQESSCRAEYSVSSIEGASDNAFLTVVVTPFLTPVTAVGDVATVAAQEAVVIDVLANDSPFLLLNPSTLTVVAQPLCGTASVVDGKLSFFGLTPLIQCSFDYAITSLEGQSGSAVVTVDITAQVVTAVDDFISVPSGTTTTVDVLANDSPFEIIDRSTLRVKESPFPAGCAAVSVAGEEVVFNGLTTGACFVSYEVDSFDGFVADAVVTVVFVETIATVDDQGTTYTGVDLVIDVVANDLPPGIADSSSVQVDQASVFPPGCAVVTVSLPTGEVLVSPVQPGICSFEYSVSTNAGVTSQGNGVVEILLDEITALDDLSFVESDNSVIIFPLANDVPQERIDHDSLDLDTRMTPVGCGSAVIAQPGVVIFTANSFITDCSFQYAISTVTGAKDVGLITVSITEESVVAVADIFILDVGVTSLLDVLANDEPSDKLDASTLAVIPGSITPINCGVPSVVDGEISYLPLQLGPCTFVYSITTVEGAAGTAAVLTTAVQGVTSTAVPTESSTRGATVGPSSSPPASPSLTPSGISIPSVSLSRTPSNGASPSPSGSASRTPSQSLVATRSVAMSDLVAPAGPTSTQTPILSPAAQGDVQSSVAPSPTPSSASGTGNVPPSVVVITSPDTTVDIVDDSGVLVGTVMVPQSDGVIVIVSDTSSPIDSSVASQPIDITIQRDGSEQTSFDKPLELCIVSDLDADDLCLGFFNRKGEWECEDSCLEDNGKSICGTTDHLTSFALLLDNSDKSSCSSSDNSYTLIYVSSGAVALALLAVLVAVTLLEARIRLKKYRLEQELTSMVDDRMLSATL